MIQLSKFCAAFVTCHLLLSQMAIAFPQNDSRIVGGSSTTISEAPYLVQILLDGNFHCGGSVASDRHIITAAHCVKNISPDRFTVVAAASKITDYGIRSKVAKIIVHVNYNEITFDSDIAVMKLKSRILGPSVTIAPSCDIPVNTEDPVQLFGWGRLYEDANFIPAQLQTVKVKIVDQASCKAMYYNRHEITDNMFCAALPRKDACSGDSGGPVMVKGKLCGVVSWGIGCARSDSPGVYTRLNSFSSFLQRALLV